VRARSDACRYARDQRQVKQVCRLSPPPILGVFGGERLASCVMAGVALSEEGPTSDLPGTGVNDESAVSGLNIARVYGRSILNSVRHHSRFSGLSVNLLRPMSLCGAEIIEMARLALSRLLKRSCSSCQVMLSGEPFSSHVRLAKQSLLPDEMPVVRPDEMPLKP